MSAALNEEISVRKLQTGNLEGVVNGKLDELEAWCAEKIESEAANIMAACEANIQVIVNMM